MFGGDLPSSDAFTINLLTNSEVLNVDQDSSHGHESYRDSGIISWTADVPESTAKYIAVFNTTDVAKPVDLSWVQLGLESPHGAVHDLWGHANLGVKSGISLSLAPHASVFYKVVPHR
jgi:hypothetical protein